MVPPVAMPGEPSGLRKPKLETRCWPMGKDDFRHKYSPVLTLLGNAQNPAYAHPKLLGCCYDNIYHNGWFIGDLPARAKTPTEEQTKKIYNQEYEEVVARIEHMLNLMDESPSYSMIPTSLINPDIVLPHRLFWECHGFPEIPKNMPIFQLDDVDHDPQFNQYPYQEGDDYDYDDDGEEMEVES